VKTPTSADENPEPFVRFENLQPLKPLKPLEPLSKG